MRTANPPRRAWSCHGQATEIETSPLGVASFELTPDTDAVGLTIKATDAAGRVGRAHVQLRCGTTSDDFLMRPTRPSIPAAKR